MHAAFLPHDTVRDLIRRCPPIGDAFWRETLIDAAVFREWMLGLGRREAYGRMAHLLCELYVRLKAVGLTNGDGYAFPLTQAELGDALGLSTVHVNRTLQDLRGEGLITLQGGLLRCSTGRASERPEFTHIPAPAQSGGMTLPSGSARTCQDPSPFLKRTYGTEAAHR